jgi:hypothetical protein
MRILKLLPLAAILAVAAFAQANPPVPGVDYPSPIPVPFIGYTYGANPATCVPGRSPFNIVPGTSATVYFCSARNTWTSNAVVSSAVSGTTGTFTGNVSALNFIPKTVGTSNLGAAATPLFKLYLGTAATNNFVFTPASTSAARTINIADPGGTASLAFLNSTNAQTLTTTTVLGDSTTPSKTVAISLSGATASTATTLTFAQSAARTVTFPDASITVSGAQAQACGSTATCGATSIGATLKIVQGSGTLVTGSPSTFAVTAMSPAFTSASTYTCVAQDTATIATNIGVLTAGYVSGSAVTFTGPNSNTDTFRYTCTGY